MCRLLQSAMWWNERDFGRTINKKVLWSGKSKVAGPTFATCHGKGQSIYYLLTLALQRSHWILPFNENFWKICAVAHTHTLCAAHTLCWACREQRCQNFNDMTGSCKMWATSDACEWLVRRLTFHVSLVSLWVEWNFNYSFVYGCLWIQLQMILQRSLKL